MSERKDLKKIILMTGVYYQRDLSPDVLAMMVDDLSDLDEQKCIESYQTYRRDPKNRTFPLPAQIREIVSPTLTTMAQARDIPERIKSAIRLFGYMRGEEARAYIGEQGWNIVNTSGGWSSVCCDNYNNLFSDSARYAQVRDRANDLFQYGDDFSNENGFLELQCERKSEGDFVRVSEIIKFENPDDSN